MAPLTPQSSGHRENDITLPRARSHTPSTHPSDCSQEQTDGYDSSDEHEFQPPDESASRSPCPALNTLANHGYLPRSGRNIRSSDLRKALKHPNTYHISTPLTEVLVEGGLLLLGKLPPICLYDLARHNRIEHDASLVHKDTPPGQENAPIEVDEKLLEELLGGQEFLTLDAVAKRRVSVERAPSCKIGPFHAKIARGEWALVMDIFGREHGGKVPTDFLREWLKYNRFPKGWKAKHEQGLIDTKHVSKKMEEKMEAYRTKRKHGEEDGTDIDETDRELALVWQTMPEESQMEPGKDGQSNGSSSAYSNKRQKTG